MRSNSLLFPLLAALVAVLAAPLMAAPPPPYEADWESLDTRPAPEWYLDAKLGIFIHWGIYSVPAYASPDSYSEWYWRNLREPPNDGNERNDRNRRMTQEFHKRVYGEDFSYPQFAPMFTAELFDPTEWADIFDRAGAKYVVLTSKHHDGYCLFPSEESNRAWGRPWDSVDIGPNRDLLGDLGDAVRAEGMKMGFYYSLYEWYNPLWLTDRQLFVEKHMFPQFKDVVTRYKPSIIFSDGEWDMPPADWNSAELIAWLYNESPVKDDVIINDRWGKGARHNHGGYFTTEYGAGMPDASHPWEENRGMGFSYGYNRAEPLENYRTGKELVWMFADLVARGGNLLLNVGPRSDGKIPEIMQERLFELGDWLAVNGEAIYGTRTWRETAQWTSGEMTEQTFGEYRVKYDVVKMSGQQPKDGKAVKQVFFTRKDDTLYAITPGWPGESLILRDIRASKRETAVTMLGRDEQLAWSQKGDDIVIRIPQLSPDELPCRHAWTFKLTAVE